MAHIEALRHGVEGECDQRSCLGSRLIGVTKSSLQQLPSDATPLHPRRNEQLGKKPEVAAYPAEGGPNDVAPVFSDPEPARVLIEAEQLEGCRTNRCHRTESVPLGQIIDAAYDQLLCALQLISPCGPQRYRHDIRPEQNSPPPW